MDPLIEHEIPDPDSLEDVPAFRAFLAGIGARCDIGPVGPKPVMERYTNLGFSARRSS